MAGRPLETWGRAPAEQQAKEAAARCPVCAGLQRLGAGGAPGGPGHLNGRWVRPCFLLITVSHFGIVHSLLTSELRQFSDCNTGTGGGKWGPTARSLFVPVLVLKPGAQLLGLPEAGGGAPTHQCEDLEVKGAAGCSGTHLPAHCGGCHKEAPPCVQADPRPAPSSSTEPPHHHPRPSPSGC